MIFDDVDKAAPTDSERAGGTLHIERLHRPIGKLAVLQGLALQGADAAAGESFGLTSISACILLVQAHITSITRKCKDGGATQRFQEGRSGEGES